MWDFAVVEVASTLNASVAFLPTHVRVYCYNSTSFSKYSTSIKNTNSVPEFEQLTFFFFLFWAAYFLFRHKVYHKIVWHATQGIFQGQEGRPSDSVLKVRDITLEEVALNCKYRQWVGIKQTIMAETWSLLYCTKISVWAGEMDQWRRSQVHFPGPTFDSSQLHITPFQRIWHAFMYTYPT